jgi:hypothetical protein
MRDGKTRLRVAGFTVIDPQAADQRGVVEDLGAFEKFSGGTIGGKALKQPRAAWLFYKTSRLYAVNSLWFMLAAL